MLLRISSQPDARVYVDSKPLKKALKYAAAWDKQTRALKDVSDKLLDSFAMVSVQSKPEFEERIQNAEIFLFFGHGSYKCLYDETGLCTIKPDDKLEDKILVLTACKAGTGYAAKAVRKHNAKAALGWALPLSARLADSGFYEGFDDCFLAMPLEILNADEITESVIMSAYERAVSEFNSLGDLYSQKGDSFTASLCYANAKNLVYYTQWDVKTTVHIDVTPTPCEVFRYDWESDSWEFSGMAPLDLEVTSGGNVFRYKAIGCFLTWFVANVPKTGGSYSLQPVSLEEFGYDVRHYEDEKVYVEYEREVWVPSDEEQFVEAEVNLVNYGDKSKSFMVECSAGVMNCPTYGSAPHLSGELQPHKLGGLTCKVRAKRHELEGLDCIDVNLKIGSVKDKISIKLRGLQPPSPAPPSPAPPSPAPPSPGPSPPPITFAYAGTAYDRLRNLLREKGVRNIAIGEKVFTEEEIIEEIRKKTDEGLMILDILKKYLF